MNDEQFKALGIVGALLVTLSSGGGFTAGRMSAPVQPPPAPIVERVPYIVEVPVPVPVLPGKTTERMDQEPFVEPKVGEDAGHRPPVAVQPRKKVAPPVIKDKRQPAKKKHGARLPPCAVVRATAATMTWAQKIARYNNSSAEEIAHGRRCLGM